MLCRITLLSCSRAALSRAEQSTTSQLLWLLSSVREKCIPKPKVIGTAAEGFLFWQLSEVEKLVRENNQTSNFFLLIGYF
jgi:hypothetical protein